MKFIVWRESDLSNKPCKEATKGTAKYRGKRIDNVWIIKIKNLKDLIEFYNKYGNIIIGKSYYDEIPIEITIYDD